MKILIETKEKIYLLNAKYTSLIDIINISNNEDIISIKYISEK